MVFSFAKAKLRNCSYLNELNAQKMRRIRKVRYIFIVSVFQGRCASCKTVFHPYCQWCRRRKWQKMFPSVVKGGECVLKCQGRKHARRQTDAVIASFRCSHHRPSM